MTTLHSISITNFTAKWTPWPYRPWSISQEPATRSEWVRRNTHITARRWPWDSHILERWNELWLWCRRFYIPITESMPFEKILIQVPILLSFLMHHKHRTPNQCGVSMIGSYMHNRLYSGVYKWSIVGHPYQVLTVSYGIYRKYVTDMHLHIQSYVTCTVESRFNAV